jgi:hypothetical protein
LQILEAEGIDLGPFAASIESGPPDTAARADLLLVCADRISTFGEQFLAFDGTDGSWCDSNLHRAERERLEALALLRRLLLLSRQEPGPAGLLSNTTAVEALQELLPFVPLMQLATVNMAVGQTNGSVPQMLGGPADPRNQNLLFMLPPPQRAWLLADAAATVLLPGEDGKR